MFSRNAKNHTEIHIRVRDLLLVRHYTVQYSTGTSTNPFTLSKTEPGDGPEYPTLSSPLKPATDLLSCYCSERRWTTSSQPHIPRALVATRLNLQPFNQHGASCGELVPEVLLRPWVFSNHEQPFAHTRTSTFAPHSEPYKFFSMFPSSCRISEARYDGHQSVYA